MCLSPLLGAVNFSVLEKQQKNNSTNNRKCWSSISGKTNCERILGWGSMGLQLLVTILTNYTTNNHHFESAIYYEKSGAKSKTWLQAGSCREIHTVVVNWQ